MCTDERFDETTSAMTLGPVAKERWIYANAKQLLDRVIHAYGRSGLPFTLFRPFNWFGPNLDSLAGARDGVCRVITQFLGSYLNGVAPVLVDGGRQRRCFTHVDDGVDALLRILQCPEESEGRIFNIGNPTNECSIAELRAAHPRLGGAVSGALSGGRVGPSGRECTHLLWPWLPRRRTPRAEYHRNFVGTGLAA